MVASVPWAVGSPGAQQQAEGALRSQVLAGTASLLGGASKTARTASVGDQETEIFNNLTAVKVTTSRVAMHLSDRYRRALFREIDRLLSVEDWDDDSSLLDEKSFETFLRAIIYGRIRRVPSLGVAAGRVLASWRSSMPAQRLYVEFLADDRVSAVGSINGANGAEQTFSLKVPSAKLHERLIELGFDVKIFNAT